MTNGFKYGITERTMWLMPLYQYSQYMQWYLQRTRKYISLDGAYSSGSYNFIKSIRDHCAPSNNIHNPMQTLNDVYLQCNEMMNTFAQLVPTAFSTNNYEAPPTHTFDMPFAPEFQQQYESQTQTDTHPQAYTQTSVPQQQQQSFHYEGFGAMDDDEEDEEEEDEEEEDEEVPQLVRGGSGQPRQRQQQQLRVQPPRRKKSPSCGTSSHGRP
ncbi:hypothetical protein Lal_00033350 [Lupinus albus]|nr:hypothetical protein Lal_00033350 [Lupinus albus]